MTHSNPVLTSRVLIVDDDSATRSWVMSVLSARGIEVLEADSGLKAMMQCVEYRPEAVLLDQTMPGWDGLATLSNLQNLPNIKSPVCLMFSSTADKEFIEQAFAAGVVDFVQKPTSGTQLVHRIRIAIEAHRAKAELAEQQRRLNELQRLAGVAYWEFDPNNSGIVSSSEIYTMLGYASTAARSPFTTIQELVVESDIPRLMESINGLVRNWVPFELEHGMMAPNGVIRTVHTRGEWRGERSGSVVSLASIDVTPRKTAETLLEESQHFDRLTHLPNRGELAGRLASMVDIAQPQESEFALIFIGIDRFKHVNDSLGYSRGNLLLVKIAERLTVMDAEFVSRVSGDVFAAIVSVPNGTDDIFAHVNSAFIGLQSPFLIDDQEVYITTSFGVVQFPVHFGTADDLLRFAEGSMYQAKQQGGNRIVYFSREYHNRYRRRIRLETELRKALDKDQFCVYYQPQVSVNNRRIIGMEALIRWQHPLLGLISPDNFIPIAEEVGLIVPIGMWVIEQVAADLNRWSSRRYGLFKVGVNLSAQQFQCSSFPSDVEKLIHRFNISPCCLEMELTESEAMQDIEATRKVLGAFREIGILCSIDDFGTGYSSLSYLKQMPLQALKIDRTFIMDIGADGTNGDLARMIISLGLTLGLNVIAEGVEQEHHMRFLLEHGCPEAQGYLISRPMPRTQLEERFLEHTGEKDSEGSYGDNVILFDRR